ncbi:MAG: type II toxin-antitoxin system YafQ family toxin [Fibromonadaceae bacterium]|jgi:mRNA interferase YafQ|nr:type II toxin-antitoxin system YafQ family toxin [Fibromonadaceae bacterium]
MLNVTQTPQFSRDIKKSDKKHRDIATLKEIDHPLKGNYSGYRELHITWKPDFLLLYKINEDELILQRLGSHDELFI